MTKENKRPHTYSDREGRPNANDSSTYFLSEPSSTLKKIRYQKATQKQIHGVNQRPTCDVTLLDIQHRRPFAVLADNYGNVGGLPEHQLGVYNLETVRNDGKSANEESHGSFLRRDDPKISALLRQEELLRSLARKVYTDDTDQCLESAWKQELKEYLIQNGERGLANNEVAQIDFLLDDLKDLVAELGSSNTGSCPTSRQTDIHEHSSHWSDHVSCPNRHTPDEENILQTEEFCLQLHNVNRSHLTDVRKLNEEYDDQGIKLPDDILSSISMALFSPCAKRVNDESPLVLENVEYSSPLQTVPVFCPFEEGIPSPNFSASERRLLLSILGFSSPSANCNNPSQQPSCKRALLHSL